MYFYLNVIGRIQLTSAKDFRKKMQQQLSSISKPLIVGKLTSNSSAMKEAFGCVKNKSFI